MGLRSALLGLGRPAKPDLEGLGALTTAAPALLAAGLGPTGAGSICVKPVAEGTVDGSAKFEKSTDSYGYTWLTRRTSTADLPTLLADLHELGVGGEAAGFGGALLCALVPFSDANGSTVGLVYRFSRGSWYPFVPTGEQQRDSRRELEIRAVLGQSMPVERDLSRWFPVWGAPGL